MAGTLVRQEVIGSAELKALMKAMKWSEREAIGALVLLWNQSQNRKMTRAPAKLIASWCGAEKAKERDKLLETLSSEDCGFLKHVRGRLGMFEIVGNRKQVKKLKQLSELRNLGGKTTRAKFRNQNSEADRTLDAEVNTEPGVGPHSPHFPAPPCTSIPRTSPPSADEPCLPGLEEVAGAGTERLASGGNGSGDHLVALMRQLDRAGLMNSEAFERYAKSYGADRVRKALEAARSSHV